MLDRELIINTQSDDPANSLLRAFTSSTQGGLGSLTRDDGYTFGIRQTTPSVIPGRTWDDVDPGSDYIEFALGVFDLAPTAGTLSLSYNGNSTGLTNLSIPLSAATLEAALNANPARSADGAVVVEQDGNSYVISDTTLGARHLLVATPGLLRPKSGATIIQTQVGDADTEEVQILTLAQAPYAFQDVWTPYAPAAYTLTVLGTGDSGTTMSFRLTITPTPYAGTFKLLNVHLPFNATADQVATAMGISGGGSPLFEVTQFNNGLDFLVTAKSPGPYAAPAVDVSQLLVPRGAQMEVNLNTYGMFKAFSQTTADILSLQCQVRVTRPGKRPVTIHRSTQSVSRSVLNLTTIQPSYYGVYPAGSELVEATQEYQAALTSATGTVADTDLSQVDDTTIPTYAMRQIRAYATTPGAGLQTWILEPSTDPVDGAAECPTLTAGGARVWRQRA